MLLLLALFDVASADYPAQGNGLIQKDRIRSKADKLVLEPGFGEDEVEDEDAPPVTEEETIDGANAIEQAKEDIANGGEEPAPTPPHTLAAYIEKILLPRAYTTNSMLEKSLQDAQAKFGKCKTSIIDAKAPEEENAELQMGREERKLAMCMKVKTGETIKEEEFCEEWHSAAKNFNPRTLDYAKGNLKTYENILKTYYDFYPSFMKEEAKCREMISIMHSQDKHCSVRTNEIKTLFCKMKENATKVCHEYDNCHAGAKADYEWTVDKAEKLEVHTLKTWKALKCFMEASVGFSFAKSIDEDGGGNTEHKGFHCDPSKYGNGGIDLNMKTVWRGPDAIPPKEVCSSYIPTKKTDAHPSWCSWEPATTATTTLSIASQGPSGGPATDQTASPPATAAYTALIQDSANLDTNPFRQIEEYLADAESVLKKTQQ